MRWIRELRLFLLASKRIGAYIRATKSGAPGAMARAYSDSVYPPTQADLDYERKLSEKGPELPWGSALALLIPFVSMVQIFNSAISETGSAPSLPILIGWGIAQLGWVVLAFSLCVGRFRILDLTKRRTTIFAAFAIFAVGTLLVNMQAILE